MTIKYLLFLLLLTSVGSKAFAQQTSDQTFTVEGYYKAKWGYADEFIDLFKKNHYPLLKKALEKGDIVSITAEKPRLHSTEESRWDYRVTLVFKNIQAAFDPDLTTTYKKALYPDAEKLKKDEKRRFEILDAHWDVQVQVVDLEK
jgi:hypothetical protein